jgi:hypothetical protein
MQLPAIPRAVVLEVDIQHGILELRIPTRADPELRYDIRTKSLLLRIESESESRTE